PPPTQTQTENTNGRNDGHVGDDDVRGSGDDGSDQGNNRFPERDGNPASASGDRNADRDDDEDALFPPDDGESPYDSDSSSDHDSDVSSVFDQDEDSSPHDTDDEISLFDTDETATQQDTTTEKPDEKPHPHTPGLHDDPLGPDPLNPKSGDHPFLPGMNDGPLTVNFLNAIVPNAPATDAPPNTEPTVPNPGGAGDHDATDATGRPAPVDTAPPASQTTPPSPGQQPPTTTPRNTGADGGQRSAPSERDGGTRSPQRTEDISTPDSPARGSSHDGDGVRTSAESTPRTETAPPGRAGQEDSGAPTDERRGRSSSAPAPEHRTVSEDDRRGTGPRSESAPPPRTEGVENTPVDEGGERPGARGGDGSRGGDRNQPDGSHSDEESGGRHSGDDEGSGDGEEGTDDDRDRSGDEDGDGSDGNDGSNEDGQDDDQADDDASDPGESPTDGKEDREQDDDEATGQAPPPTDDPQPAPDPDYEGSVTPDRRTPHDIGYLLTSSLVNASMVHAQHLDAFVDRTLGDDGVTAPGGVRDGVRDEISAQQNRDMSAFFTSDGFSTEVRGTDGSVWRARVRLSLPEGNFYHAPTRALPDARSPQTTVSDEVGGSASFAGSGGHGGNKAFNLGFTLSPLLLGTIGVGDIGPRAIFSFTGGTRQRQTAETTTVTFDSALGYEATGAPEVYAADLGIDLTLERTTPPTGEAPAAQDGTPSPDSPASRTESTRPGEEDAVDANPRIHRSTYSSNGLALVLPGRVTEHRGPASITLSDPLDDGSDGTGTTPPARRPHPYVANGQPISVGGFREIRGENGRETRDIPSLADWVAEKMVPPEPDPGLFGRIAPHLRPRFVRERRQQLLEHFHDQTRKAFSDEAMRRILPRSTQGEFGISLTGPSGETRTVTIRSVPVSYVARPSNVPGGDQSRSSKSEHEASDSLQKHRVSGGTAGGGVGIDAGLPGTDHKARFDIVTGEGGGRHRSTQESTDTDSGSVKRTSTVKDGSGVYEVTRNYYVHFQGERRAHRLTGTGFEVLTDADAWAISGRTPPDPRDGDASTGQSAAPDDSHSGRGGTSQKRDGSAPAPGRSTRATDPGEARRAGVEGPETRGSQRDRTTENRTALPGDIVPRNFTWPNGGLHDSRDGGPQRTIYDQILHQVLAGIHKERPGLVLPDITSGSEDFNRPPGGERRNLAQVLRGHRPFSRDEEVAAHNTAQIRKAISEAGFHGGIDDLRTNGITVHLIETARLDPSSDKATGTYLTRPPISTVRIRAEFSGVRRGGDGDGGDGTRGISFEYGGASKYDTGTGTQDRGTAKGSTGFYTRPTDTADANQYPPRSGMASASTTWTRTKSDSRNLGTKVKSEHGVLHPEGSRTWIATATISARLYEHDDIGMAKPGASTKPVSERGINLFDPIEARFTADAPGTTSGTGDDRAPDTSGSTQTAPEPRDQRQHTPQNQNPPAERDGDATGNGGRPANGSARGGDRTGTRGTGPGTGGNRPPGGPEVVEISTMDTSEARGMIQGLTTAVPENVRQRPGGLVRATRRLADRFHTGTDGTGGERRQDDRTHRSPRTDRIDRTGTTGADTGRGPTVGADDARDPSDRDDPADQRTKGQRQADVIRSLGPTYQHLTTRFTTEDGHVNSLVEAYYGHFLKHAPWDTDGTGDGPRLLQFERNLRKLRDLLTRSEGSKQYPENALSEDGLRNNPAVHASSGLRTHTDQSGGLRSGHNLRTESATRYDVDEVTSLEQSDAALSWKDTTSLDVSTTTSTKDDVNVRGGGAGRYNPNPMEPTAGGAEHSGAPNSATDPRLHAGPALGRSVYDWSVSDTPSQKFSETVEFKPGIHKSYRFNASGVIKQAVEFSRNWRYGPPFPHTLRFRGMQARLHDLAQGLVHVRDAQQSGLVEDRVVEGDDGTLSLAPQREPRHPEHVRVRPGAEDSGKLMRPPSADRALRDLTDRLARSGWELTRNSRKEILHALTSYRGLRPNNGPPLPVKVKPIGHSILKGNTTSTTAVSFEAKVNLRLDTRNPRIDYVGGRAQFTQRQTLESGHTGEQGRSSSTTAGLQDAVVPPLPYSGGDQPSGQDPTSRPTAMNLSAGQSASRAHGEATSVKDSGTRSVEMSTDTPYANVSMDSELTIDLEISEHQGFSNTLAWENLDEDEQRGFRGRGDSGTVRVLYPAFSIDLPRTGDGADGSPDTSGNGGPRHEGDGSARRPGPAADPRTASNGDGTQRVDGRRAERTPSPPPPENPSSDTYASFGEMMRNWAESRNRDGDPDVRDAVLLPTSVTPVGQDPRDTAHVVVARSLGWSPPPGSVDEGRYTAEAVADARAHVADKIGVNVRNNAIDHSLNPLALKSLFLRSLEPGGSDMIRMGRSRWNVRALPDPRSARVIDYNPDVRLSDSHESEQTFTSTHNTSNSLAGSLDGRPAGQAGADMPTGRHVGSSGLADSTTVGGTASESTDAKGPSRAKRTRTGPGYLVEFDTTWAIGARTELRGAWYKRAAKQVGHKSADLGRATVDQVRRVFGRQTGEGSPRERPSRWQRGEVDTKVTTWISHGDAVRLGVIAPDGVDHLKPLTDRFTEAQDALAEAEKDYLDAREPLDKAARRVVDTRNALDADRGEGTNRDGATGGSQTDPGDVGAEGARQAREEYDRLRRAHDTSRDAFDTALREWSDALRDLRRALVDTPPVQPPRTESAPDTTGTSGTADTTGTSSGDGKGKAPVRTVTGSGSGGPSVSPEAAAPAPPADRGAGDSGQALRDRLGENFGVSLDGGGDTSDSDDQWAPGSGSEDPGGSDGSDGFHPARHPSRHSGESDTVPLPSSDPRHTASSPSGYETDGSEDLYGVSDQEDHGVSPDGEDGLVAPVHGADGASGSPVPEAAAVPLPESDTSSDDDGGTPVAESGEGDPVSGRGRASEQDTRTRNTSDAPSPSLAPSETGEKPTAGPANTETTEASRRNTPAPRPRPRTARAPSLDTIPEEDPQRQEGGDVPSQQEPPPSAEQPSTLSAPESDLAAFFDHALNGSPDREGYDADGSSSEGETTDVPVPAEDDGGVRKTAGPGPEGGNAAENTEDEDGAESGSEDEGDDAENASAGKNTRGDGDEDDGNDPGNAPGGDRSGSGGGDRSGDGDGSGGRHRSERNGGDREAEGDDGRSPKEDGQDGGSSRDSGNPTQRHPAPDTEPVPDLVPDDDDMSLYDDPDTLVEDQPSHSLFDEPPFTPLWERDDHALSVLDPKYSGDGNGPLGFLNPKSGFDHPLPASLTDFMAAPVIVDADQPGNRRSGRNDDGRGNGGG
ncbi:hypothetical protein, partial [Nocardiopsis halotolerans]|uniref:hypothetical protein n=1 Tax=Nocardiopsis halotolerans TaxID=124252 RepID=UPI0005937BFF